MESFTENRNCSYFYKLICTVFRSNSNSKRRTQRKFESCCDCNCKVKINYNLIKFIIIIDIADAACYCYWCCLVLLLVLPAYYCLPPVIPIFVLFCSSNTTLCIGKFYAASISGSSSLFSEALHSLADAVNGSLLFFGIKRSLRAPGTQPLSH